MRTIVKWKVDDAINILKDVLNRLKDDTISTHEINKAIKILGGKKKMSKAEKAFELQERIGRLIDKLDALGFEFMYFNFTSSIRRKRK